MATSATSSVSAPRGIRDAERWQRLKFCVFFAVYLGLAMAAFPHLDQLLGRIHLRPVAIGGSVLLNAIGISASLDAGTAPAGFCTLVMDQLTFRIIHECTGIFHLFVFLAAVMAYPCSISQKARGGVLGVFAFVAYGAIRLALLGVVGHFLPDLIQFFHMWLMVLVGLGFSLFLWLYWSRGVALHA